MSELLRKLRRLEKIQSVYQQKLELMKAELARCQVAVDEARSGLQRIQREQDVAFVLSERAATVSDCVVNAHWLQGLQHRMELTMRQLAEAETQWQTQRERVVDQRNQTDALAKLVERKRNQWQDEQRRRQQVEADDRYLSTRARNEGNVPPKTNEVQG